MLYSEGDDLGTYSFEEGVNDATHHVKQAVSSTSSDPL